MRNTTAGIKAEIAKGVFRPHTALTNMALAYYQNASNYFAKALFPTCPVGLSSDNYYIFSREDLLRDNWQRKPAYGKVDPTTIGESTDNYVCKVDQMIMGIDQIRQTTFPDVRVHLSFSLNSSALEQLQNRLTSTRTVCLQRAISKKEHGRTNLRVLITPLQAQTSSLSSAMQILTLLHLSTKRRPT